MKNTLGLNNAVCLHCFLTILHASCRDNNKSKTKVRQHSQLKDTFRLHSYPLSFKFKKPKSLRHIIAVALNKNSLDESRRDKIFSISHAIFQMLSLKLCYSLTVTTKRNKQQVW